MLSALTVLAAEAEHGEPVVHPYVVGAIALALLLLLVLAVISFGGGREHS
ncbi:hypothetical protein [Nocardioides sp.]|jgi:hypothetical protein|nr:hypothetical protein [Nocardioides sp.]MCW2736430.1 hypothetical protein [Nocardioides sp.]